MKRSKTNRQMAYVLILTVEAGDFESSTTDELVGLYSTLKKALDAGVRTVRGRMGRTTKIVNFKRSPVFEAAVKAYWSTRWFKGPDSFHLSISQMRVQ